MKTLIIRAYPASAEGPGRTEIASTDLNPAEALFLLERAKAALLQQGVPSLDGEVPPPIEVPTQSLRDRLLRAGS